MTTHNYMRTEGAHASATMNVNGIADGLMEGHKTDTDFAKGNAPDQAAYDAVEDCNVIGSYILVKREENKADTTLGIKGLDGNELWKPDTATDRDRLFKSYGHVMKMGTGAFKDIRTGDTFPVFDKDIKVGQRVLFSKHSGIKFTVRHLGEVYTYLLLKDNEILMTIPDDLEIGTDIKVSN